MLVHLKLSAEDTHELRRRLELTTENITVFGIAPTFTLIFLDIKKGDIFQLTRISSSKLTS